MSDTPRTKRAIARWSVEAKKLYLAIFDEMEFLEKELISAQALNDALRRKVAELQQQIANLVDQ